MYEIIAKKMPSVSGLERAIDTSYVEGRGLECVYAIVRG